MGSQVYFGGLWLLWALKCTLETKFMFGCFVIHFQTASACYIKGLWLLWAL